MTTERKSGIKAPSSRVTTPVWAGPCGEGSNGGVTQSLLAKWLVCRERFRLYTVEGLRPSDAFEHRRDYGSMWHACEEALAKKGSWKPSLDMCSRKLCERYRMAQEQIEHWRDVCRVQFPLYVEYWAAHPDVTSRVPLLQEQAFDVPYVLPSQRVVRLRGKWDSVDVIGEGRDRGIYIQENKTKSDINEPQLRKQLRMDLQTMLYRVALEEEWLRDKGWAHQVSGVGIRGVRYNTVRRPLSGGKGSIRQHKSTKKTPGETREAFYTRLGSVIQEDPGYFFVRFKGEVLPADVQKFKHQCLNPMLEQLCDWWEYMSGVVARKGDPFENPCLHSRVPYGSYSSIIEGASGDLDELLATGSELGLTRVETLFEELA